GKGAACDLTLARRCLRGVSFYLGRYCRLLADPSLRCVTTPALSEQHFLVVPERSVGGRSGTADRPYSPEASVAFWTDRRSGRYTYCVLDADSPDSRRSARIVPTSDRCLGPTRSPTTDR